MFKAQKCSCRYGPFCGGVSKEVITELLSMVMEQEE
jgi:hypothetical protein